MGFDLDNFKCYRVRDLKTPKFAETTVSLSDQLAINDGSVGVRKPFLYCKPVAMADEEGNRVNDVRNPIDHLTCYKVRNADAAGQPVSVDNTIGSIVLRTRHAALLCVPSTSITIR